MIFRNDDARAGSSPVPTWLAHICARLDRRAMVALFSLGAGLAVLAWASTLHAAFLIAAAVALATAGGLLLTTRPEARPPSAGLLAGGALILATGLAAGALAEWQLLRVTSSWDAIVSQERRAAAGEIESRMGRVVESARASAERAAAAADSPTLAAVLESLQDLAADPSIAAVALIDPAGELTAWAGDHRGPLPDRIRHDEVGIAFVERPLFSYLYAVHQAGERGARAVAAVLMEVDPALAIDETSSVVGQIAGAVGARPRFDSGAPPPGALWRLDAGEVSVLHATLEPPTQRGWRARVVTRAGRAVLVLVGLALVLILLGWRPAGIAGTAALVAAALLLAPLESVPGLAPLFSPALFLLPVPVDVTLGSLLILLLTLGVVAATMLEPERPERRRAAFALAGLAWVVIAYPLLIGAMIRSSAPPLLEGGWLLWGALHAAMVLLLAVVTAPLLPSLRARLEDRRRGASAAMLALATATAAVLAIAVLLRGDPRMGPAPWASALWAAPFLIFLVALPAPGASAGRLLRWCAVGWLAVTATLPQLWLANVHARLASAEVELATLGTEPDPFLEFLLHRFTDEVGVRAERGEEGVELLYRAWVGSGLARQGYPARLTFWDRDGAPRNELEVGGGGELRREDPGEYLWSLLERAREHGLPVASLAPAPHVNQVLVVPLGDRRLVSIQVFPRRTLDPPTPLVGPIGGPERRGEMRLSLVPTSAPVTGEGPILWRPTEFGWRSETDIRYPDGLYHAHLEVRTAPLPVRIARGSLLLAFILLLLVGLWLAGRTLGGEPPAPPGGWRSWLASFRSRVTLALFLFFIVPTALFGIVAYRALAGDVIRSAAASAQAAVAQAVREFERAAGDLGELARLTRQEVLFYHRGELAGASSPETMGLGIYGAWMPPRAYLALESGEELSVVAQREIVGRRYVVAYHRLPPAGTLAVPVSPSAGDALVRQRELTHLVLFAALVGALLSLGLSVLVGRALAGPIGSLRRAANAVGAGRLRVRLPEERRDEFGELFTSFNRMARQLRRARARELRTARVLAWGEMARQVAHEVKNPLTPIKLSVQHLLRAYADRRGDFGDILEANVEQILLEIDRLSEIARAFSRYGAPAEAAGPLQPVDVAAAIREVLALYRSGEGEIHFVDRIEPGLPRARARAGELKEVLINLLENARAAVDGNGRVELSARRSEDGVLEVEVTDDGEGIPPEQLPHIFEPQFSTRSAGTGLGLAIVRRLVESWDGDVEAESAPGEGTSVCVRVHAWTEDDLLAVRGNPAQPRVR